LHNRAVLDWNDLRHFLAFARQGSTLAAAKALGVNQSTVQRRIAELEARLGQRLIERHLGSYRLTELGAELEPYAANVEAAVTALERRVASCGRELAGVVRVTCPTTVADRLRRTALIDMFEARYPGLRVELVLSDQFLDLAKGEADIAIRAGEPEDEALIGRKIAETPWAVYASRSYGERYGRLERLEDIERHLVVAFDGPIADYAAARWLRSVAPRATIAARCDNWPGVVLAVKSGAGLSPMPTFHGDGESDLVRLFENIPELVTSYYLLAHRDMQRTPRVRAFLDFVGIEIKAFRAMLSGRAEGQRRDARSPIDGSH
jgi:DNA-binding transcriptional LysR family regulator